jgi:hypothetical protein
MLVEMGDIVWNFFIAYRVRRDFRRKKIQSFQHRQNPDSFEISVPRQMTAMEMTPRSTQILATRFHIYLKILKRT